MGNTTPFLFLFLLLSLSFAEAIKPAYPGKNTPNTNPNPNPSRVVCDEAFSCPARNTCCCVYRVRASACYAWGCCPHENGTCCDTHSCCPQDRPVCDTYAHTCSISKGNPLGVKAMMTRIPAKSIRRTSGEKSSS